jgi:hypothetical protein
MKPSSLLFVAALALAIGGAAAIGEPYPAGDCRTGTPACPNGCCSAACPTGAAGAAIANGTPGLTATIKGLTYDPKTALVKGTVVTTNAGKAPVNGLIASVQFAPFSPKDGGSYQTLENLWCSGQKGKALAPGASRACPFALVGGADPSEYDWNKATGRDPLPGVDANALKAALSFSTSEVRQVVELRRGMKPSAVSAHATLRNTELYPQPNDKSGGFICGYAFVPAVAAQ